MAKEPSTASFTAAAIRKWVGDSFVDKKLAQLNRRRGTAANRVPEKNFLFITLEEVNKMAVKTNQLRQDALKKPHTKIPVNEISNI